ncbi:aminotransferase class V-fold PLP-dependent enzyme [Pseudacidobacterium ailaaui]|uniref:aminotransferase class V-fold PLP-dependent enzyme n=1 Tax=Pseudacidobacterium ailaaui TaxID=1382359 RepID=UPI00047C9408|nr:aminotransferase class V-fold PLP-dependent enzyme [Pseudacidobacterium ailaaui]MBX6359888.1 aminotransferase class V-fold PLP-dependent enzyme [Pseudacidobacterium ailaaui]MDI3254816.1 aminotransferase class V-fold PLP-dependent enzyme [Bacillota bacterium]
MNPTIHAAVSQLGPGPLTEEAVQRHLAPLFSRVLSGDRIYLANHSLGRPLDTMADDVREAITLWETKLGDAWDEWLAEREAFRARIAGLLKAPRTDCIVPKTSAGQGLRAVLNALPGRPRVLSTRGEFDSIDLILKQYASLGRIALSWAEPDAEGHFSAEKIASHLRGQIDLVVVSQVMFETSQVVGPLDQLADACHATGAQLLVDAYHAIGVLPVDVSAMHVDFMIGGSYKYLRGGPGAAFLYLSPRALDGSLRPLDTGWFAREDFFAFQRSETPLLKPGGDAFLEATPPVLSWYQARSGQQFTLAVGVERLREYGLRQLQRFRQYLADFGIHSTGGGHSHGAFLTVRHPQADRLAVQLKERNIITDARGSHLRLCPDCLTRDEEMRAAAAALAEIL